MVSGRMLFPSHVICCFQLMSFACIPWLSGRDHAALCLQQAVILGVLSFFMAWVVQAFFASVLLDILNAGIAYIFLCSPLQSPPEYKDSGFVMVHCCCQRSGDASQRSTGCPDSTVGSD